MRVFAITRSGTCTVALLVLLLWSIVLMTAHTQHQIRLDWQRARQESSLENLHRAHRTVARPVLAARPTST